jgi:predicted hotdog family 3-hydroxylacyl-ACP dehydratase
MLMDKSQIARLIPHDGAMCLLDGVTHWDIAAIRCVASSHRDPRNPLRRGDRLRAVCGVEYASQAMALHGALSGAIAQRPRSGYLVSVRDLVCRVERLDTLEGALEVEAERLLGDEHRVMYRFALRCGAAELLGGRAAVVLDAQAAA